MLCGILQAPLVVFLLGIALHKFTTMTRIFLLGAAALLFCTAAQGIVCKVCESGNAKGCYSTIEFCKSDYGKCYTYAGYVDNEIYFMSYDCVYNQYWSWYCNKTEKDEKYVHVETCCETDKCNGEIPPLPRDWN